MSHIILRKITYITSKLGSAGKETRTLTYQVDLDGDQDSPVRVLNDKKKWVLIGINLSDFVLDSARTDGDRATPPATGKSGKYAPGGDMPVVRRFEHDRVHRYRAACVERGDAVDDTPTIPVIKCVIDDPTKMPGARRWTLYAAPGTNEQASCTVADLADDLAAEAGLRKIKELRDAIHNVDLATLGGGRCCLSAVYVSGDYAESAVAAALATAKKRNHDACVRAATLMTDMTDDQMRDAGPRALSVEIMLLAGYPVHAIQARHPDWEPPQTTDR